MFSFLLHPWGILYLDQPPGLFPYPSPNWASTTRLWVPFIEMLLGDEEAWDAQFTNEQRIAHTKVVHGNRPSKKRPNIRDRHTHRNTKGHNMVQAKQGIVLGFIGSGETSAKNATALLSDQVDAHGGARFIIPGSPDYWNDGIEAVADFATENKIPLEVVMDDEGAADKRIKPYITVAAKTTKVVNVGSKIVKLLGAEDNARLVVLWNDEDALLAKAATEAAEAEVRMLDLTSGLDEVEIQVQQTNDNKGEGSDVANDAFGGNEVTEEWLASCSDQEIEGIADALEINHREIPTWDEVRALIFERHGSPADGGGGGEGDSGGEGYVTVEDVQGWDFETCKAFAQDNNIEVPPRSKTAGYQAAIIDWLTSDPEASGEVEPDAATPPSEDETLPTMERVAEMVEQGLTNAFQSVLGDKLDSLEQRLGTLGVSVDKLTTSVEEGFKEVFTAMAQNGPEERPPSTGVKKAASTAKAAPANVTSPAATAKKVPAKATAAKKIARPATGKA